MANNKAAWKKRLKNLSGYKENKEAEAPEFDNCPDGRYDARITNAELKLSKNKEEMIMISMVIIGDSEEADRKVNSFLMLEGAGSPGAFGTLKKMGYELPEESEDLAEVIQDITESEKEVIINVKKGFAGIDGLLDEEPAIASDDEPVNEEEPATEEEAIVEETEDVIDVGDDVSFTFKGEEMEGTIIQILEDEQKAKIKSGAKSYLVSVDNISKIEAEVVEEEPAEEPKSRKEKKVVKKTPAKKVPAKKSVKK